MKGKTIIGMIATAALCVVMGLVSSNLKEDNKRNFQEALDKYKNSSKEDLSDSVVRQRMLNDVQTLKKKYEENVFPTKGEIDSVNAKLPVLVTEGTLFTNVEYDEKTKVQTFNYQFTQEVDESMLTKDVMSQLKANVVLGIKRSPQSVKRINAGVTYHYVYYSVKNKKLYELKIDSNDIN